MTVQTHDLTESASRSSASRSVRAAWAALGAFLLIGALFEAVKHGGWVIPAVVAGGLVPDLSFLVDASGPHRPGQLPRGTVRAYNLLHRPILPIVVMAIPVALGAGGTAVPFTFGLAWLAHIALGRAVGYGLRAPDGWQR